MNRLIVLFFVSNIFAQDHSAPSDAHGGSWIDSWLMPDPGLFFWTLVTFFIVLAILKVKAW